MKVKVKILVVFGCHGVFMVAIGGDHGGGDDYASSQDKWYHW